MIFSAFLRVHIGQKLKLAHFQTLQTWIELKLLTYKTDSGLDRDESGPLQP